MEQGDDADGAGVVVAVVEEDEDIVCFVGVVAGVGVVGNVVTAGVVVVSTTKVGWRRAELTIFRTSYFPEVAQAGVGQISALNVDHLVRTHPLTLVLPTEAAGFPAHEEADVSSTHVVGQGRAVE